MCRMCDWLGDGEVWYKNPRNYANRLYKLREPGTGPQMARGTSLNPAQAAGEGAPQASNGAPRPAPLSLRTAVEARANGDAETFQKTINELNRRSSTRAGAQVVPLSDIQEVIMRVGMPVGAMMCICRKNTRGEEERSLDEYSCLGLGTGMYKWERWPERYRGGVEFLSPKQACEFVEYWNRRGMVQILMQEGGDFIGGICNCDYPDCIAIRDRVDYGLNYSLTKAEYFCEVDYEACNGCGECLGRCQFNALKYESTIDKPNIDPMNCYGCGVCMTACNHSAIKLTPRSAYAAMKHVW